MDYKVFLLSNGSSINFSMMCFCGILEISSSSSCVNIVQFNLFDDNKNRHGVKYIFISFCIGNDSESISFIIQLYLQCSEIYTGQLQNFSNEKAFSMAIQYYGTLYTLYVHYTLPWLRLFISFSVCSVNTTLWTEKIFEQSEMIIPV